MTRNITVNRNNFTIGKTVFQTGATTQVDDATYASLVAAGRISDGSITDGGLVPVPVPLQIASQAERVVKTETIPGASPFVATCPAGKVMQFFVSGGAAITTSINNGAGLLIAVSGTGATPIITAGETISIAWTTVPSAIRSRILYTT